MVKSGHCQSGFNLTYHSGFEASPAPKCNKPPEGGLLVRIIYLDQRKHQSFLCSFLAIADRQRLIDTHCLVPDR
jgi:hypothetical protein